MGDDLPSSPAPAGFATTTEELAYYKSQYEQLELELQDFQASSRELETELEKDVEASEKRERQLQEKVENLGFEAEEWKTKYKQAKNEAGNAQSTLQKEITSLRDSNRTMQFKLRDIEVANDDYERQARNTTSSLEDLESKYNVSIEHGVMLEEEIKIGEQEREGLRIENQRIRDELSDLKIEAEIIQEKLRLAEANIAQGHLRQPSRTLAVETLRSQSPISESTSATTVSSPTVSTPPATKSEPSTLSATPPSPPLSESAGLAHAPAPVTPAISKPRTRATTGASVSRKPGLPTTRTPSHIRGPSIASTTSATPSFRRSVTQKPAPTPRSRPSIPALTTHPAPSTTLPRSGSLHHIRALRGKMEKLEARVHSARSKLPAPTATPPRASPRAGIARPDSLHHPASTPSVPATVTVRSSKKRISSTASSRNSDIGVSGRRSLGGARTPVGGERGERTSLLGGFADAGGTYISGSRPSSRASVASNAGGFVRPSSRASMSNIRAGARTPVGFSGGSAQGAAGIMRPRSSVSGTFAPPSLSSSLSGHAGQHGHGHGHGHGHSHSVSHSLSRSVNGAGVGDIEDDEEDEDASFVTPVARRTTLDRAVAAGSGIPTPAGLKRQSKGGEGRRQSGVEGEMGPPERRGRLSGVGETY
ncbi:hypothetical protein P152DRAFT_504873 [Eremomyces bilateralis CBS 781.70]|uniref:NUDE domain-containing protein n=1 Tax=Eremomyces bilateralis CBS 781.70 TaxID=1392243 RepID=A0A6G1GDI8_9PEZI|nr:uncharacterized protein P152DRAFT_504873 [Eremomyces bilateralis CBS 781.70]KAF1816103.1 hypothetical protein P152DRAFT_504873 [Eremomyces bilateralis CBS 781.70]